MQNKLNILWVNDNVETAHLMVFMYAINSKLKGWWDDVNLIIWGATAKLVATDKGIQEKIKMAQHAGVKIEACRACSDQFGVTQDLIDLGIELKLMGEPLTQILKEDAKLLTI
ncbi:DsrE family protein [Candidatus Epulonipiscium fishelsonii]|uniref:DsrE family protein n=1 Tax=Candidatus Epulonipiscium fishelsonii TaxID=77094 RepID=A0ACC8XB00_9FIRM|nr:DsrE family protein [Epulopiscium sp. SCG-B05WGA-EpuloA1]ONI39567.1 DsrE family protein [Epulopiscium sp. SCG-B11WGA-EpuloA1]ONI46839.1 DsrE family protein [Epulopiscium sp. SCG-C06WGA-EpuloA1]